MIRASLRWLTLLGVVGMLLAPGGVLAQDPAGDESERLEDLCTHLAPWLFSVGHSTYRTIPYPQITYSCPLPPH